MNQSPERVGFDAATKYLARQHTKVLLDLKSILMYKKLFGKS